MNIRLQVRNLINEILDEKISSSDFDTAHDLLSSPYDDDYRGESSAGFDKFGFNSVWDLQTFFVKFGLDKNDVSMTKRFGYRSNVKSKVTGFQYPVEDGPFGSGVFVSMIDPFKDDEGYCHYVGISGDKQFTKAAFTYLKKVGFYDDAEFGTRGYI